MKDLINKDCLLNIAKINTDKNFVILEVQIPINTKDNLSYGVSVPNPFNYYIKLKNTPIDAIKINSFCILNKDTFIEYSISKYINKNSEEVSIKWVHENQFDFSTFNTNELPIRVKI